MLATLAAVSAHAVGLYGGAYLHLPHYDTFVHTLAGVWVGLVVVALAKKAGVPGLSPAIRIIAVASATIAIGFGWELFEYLLAWISITAYDVKNSLQPSIGDTLKDILTDGAGGAIAAILSAPVRRASDRSR